MVSQPKENTHSNTEGKDREDTLPQAQTKKHGFGVVADFLVYFYFHDSHAPFTATRRL
jgi:hypothetical protein